MYSAVIDGYCAEGLGVARIDGQVVFVHGGVRGEVCDVLVMKTLKNTAYGKVIAVHAPSPRRVEPDCPYYGKCGGCDFRHLDYDEELWAKRQRVQEALRRLGGSGAAVEEILGASSVRRYRNKAQYEISPTGEAGFFRARSHQVVDVEQCLLQSEAADAAAQALRAYIRQYDVPCYDEKTGKGLLRHLLVRNNCKGQILVCVFANGTSLPHEEELTELLRQAVPDTVGVVLGVHREKGNAVLGESYRTLWGADALEDTLCGLTFHLSVPSFYQVHHDQAQRLYEKAMEFAALTGQETVLDLYCGAGTITQVLARHAKEAVGAEIVPAAVENARESARRNGVENVRFFCGDAAAVAADFAARGAKPDVVCVDPPRKGLAPEVIESVASMAPSRVVYVSCDPATLGRDVKRFSAYGYDVARAAAIDMFPRTRHVETVVLMTRTGTEKG